METFKKYQEYLASKGLIKSKKIEEDVNSDPNRMVGTGTYTPTHSDANFNVAGYFDNTDPSSMNSSPAY
jgi:hypothetical protein